MLETENVWPQLPEAIIEEKTMNDWKPHGRHVSAEGRDYEYPIATVTYILPEEEAYKHARLIAAAPDLLEACREAINILTLAHTPRTLQEHAQVRLDAKHILRVAINKATKGA